MIKLFLCLAILPFIVYAQQGQAASNFQSACALGDFNCTCNQFGLILGARAVALEIPVYQNQTTQSGQQSAGTGSSASGTSASGTSIRLVCVVSLSRSNGFGVTPTISGVPVYSPIATGALMTFEGLDSNGLALSLGQSVILTNELSRFVNLLSQYPCIANETSGAQNASSTQTRLGVGANVGGVGAGANLGTNGANANAGGGGAGANLGAGSNGAGAGANAGGAGLGAGAGGSGVGAGANAGGAGIGAGAGGSGAGAGANAGGVGAGANAGQTGAGAGANAGQTGAGAGAGQTGGAAGQGAAATGTQAGGQGLQRSPLIITGISQQFVDTMPGLWYAHWQMVGNPLVFANITATAFRQALLGASAAQC